MATDDPIKPIDPQEYYNRLDPAIENLAMTLQQLGFQKENLNDDEIVDIAAKKLKMLHSMLLAANVTENMISVCMNE